MNRNERIILLLMAAVNFTHILDFMIKMPLGNFLMPYFDIDAGEFSRVVAAYNFAAFAPSYLLLIGASLLAGLIVYSDGNHRIHNYPWLGYISVFIISICLLLARRLKVK